MSLRLAIGNALCLSRPAYEAASVKRLAAVTVKTIRPWQII
jgi:hypothetical protein